jgi:hypothetical protein
MASSSSMPRFTSTLREIRTRLGLIRVYSSTAVNTGSYTFSYLKDGQTTTLPARYSFTFVKEGEKWIIVDHHSSVMPIPPG